MIIITHPDQKEVYVAYFESIFGIGVSCGPVVGAILFNIYGFLFTFAVISLSFIVLIPLFILVMPSNINEENIETQNLVRDREQSDDERPKIKI